MRGALSSRSSSELGTQVPLLVLLGIVVWGGFGLSAGLLYNRRTRGMGYALVIASGVALLGVIIVVMKG
jgi:hypothetical protein